MRRPLLAAALIAGSLLTRGALADPSRTVVLSGDGESGTVARIEAELEAQGFKTELDSAAASSPEALEGAARRSKAIAAIRLRGSHEGAEVWIVDPATSTAVLRDVVGAEGGDDALVAVRAVELLRASLLLVQPSRSSIVAEPEPATGAAPPRDTPAPPTSGDAGAAPFRRLSVAATFGVNVWRGRTDIVGSKYLFNDLSQIDVSYQFSNRLALGGVVSYFPEGEQRFFRASVEARFFGLATRFIDLWGAAEGGVAASKYSPSGCQGCNFVPRFAPSFGAALGIDLLPLRYVSLGMEGRALLPIFFSAPLGGGPTGATPTFMCGLTLAGHLPFD